MIGQPFVNIAEIAPARGGVGCDQLVICPTDLFVEREVRRTPQASPLGVLVEDAAEKQGIIADVRAKEESLFRTRPRQRDEHVRNVLPAGFRNHMRRAQTVGARKSFQERSDVIAELAIGDADIAQDMTGQDIKIKVRRNLELAGVGEDRVDQARIIEDAVARFGVAEEIDEGNVIGLGPGQSADHELEVRRGKPLPTIRPDHRKPSMSIGDAVWQALFMLMLLIVLMILVGRADPGLGS